MVHTEKEHLTLTDPAGPACCARALCRQDCHQVHKHTDTQTQILQYPVPQHCLMLSGHTGTWNSLDFLFRSKNKTSGQCSGSSPFLGGWFVCFVCLRHSIKPSVSECTVYGYGKTELKSSIQDISKGLVLYVWKWKTIVAAQTAGMKRNKPNEASQKA